MAFAQSELAGGNWIRRREWNRIARLLFGLALLSVPDASSLMAQPESPADAVTVKEGNAYTMQGERLALLTDKIKFPDGIEVNTNCSFKVGDGQERKLEEGQMLRRDGWLLNPDGSAWPVFNYVAMKEGKVVVVHDGQTEPLTKPMTFPNKLTIAPDGSYVYSDGSNAHLADGQLFRLDGTSVRAKDTITLKNGRVVVQKAGKLITLSTAQVMGMNDGSRVQGDGTIHNRDGSVTQLREGQTVLVDGAAAAH